MNIPIDGIQAFVRIAALGSFRRAAEACFVSQTGLSRRIQRLEAFVGVRLLDRTTRTVFLTPAGRDFLPLAARLVEDLTVGLDRLRTTSRLEIGDVTLATLQSVAVRQLPSALRHYAVAHPHNRVHLLERSGSLLTLAVREGHADFGIHIQGPPQADLLEDPLRQDPFVLVCAAGHALATAGTLAWHELAGIDLITLGGASGNRHVVEQQFHRCGLPGRGRFVVESVPSALALARAGVGAAILPAGFTAGPELVEVGLADPVLFRSLALVRRNNETLMPAADALYRTIRHAFASPGP